MKRRKGLLGATYPCGLATAPKASDPEGKPSPWPGYSITTKGICLCRTNLIAELTPEQTSQGERLTSLPELPVVCIPGGQDPSHKPEELALLRARHRNLPDQFLEGAPNPGLVAVGVSERAKDEQVAIRVHHRPPPSFHLEKPGVDLPWRMERKERINDSTSGSGKDRELAREVDH